MNAKKSNIAYALFLGTVLPLIIMVLCSFFGGGDDSSYTSYYNQIFKLEDYNVKVNNALLVLENGQLYFTFNYKCNNANTEWSEPEVVSVTTDYNYSKEFFVEHEGDLAKYYIALDCGQDFKFVQINMATKTAEKKMPDTIDEFGDTVPGEIIPAQNTELYIRIDYKDIVKLTTTAEKEGYVTSKAQSLDVVDVEVTTTTTSRTQIPPPIPDESKNTSSETATTTTTTTVTTTTTTTTKQSTVSTEQTKTSSATQPPKETTAPISSTSSNSTTKAKTKPTTTSTTTTKQTSKQTSSSVSDVIHVNSIKVETGYTNNNVMLLVGGKAKVTAIVLPENATDRSVKWTSNRPDIAVVDQNGNITAVGKGIAIISVVTNDKGLQAACMVTVS